MSMQLPEKVLEDMIQKLGREETLKLSIPPQDSASKEDQKKCSEPVPEKPPRYSPSPRYWGVFRGLRYPYKGI